MTPLTFTVLGMTETSAQDAISALDQRMTGLLDLALTLKHIH